MQYTIEIGNDNIVTLDGLKDKVTNMFINDATVTLQVYDKSNLQVGSDILLEYVQASDGKYRAGIDDLVTVAMIPFQRFTLKVTAEASGERVGLWEVPAYARTREA